MANWMTQLPKDHSHPVETRVTVPLQGTALWDNHLVDKHVHPPLSRPISTANSPNNIE